MTLDPVQKVISSLAVVDNKLYIGSGDYRIIEYDLYQKTSRQIEGLWEVRQIMVDESQIYVATLDETLKVYDRHSLELLHTLSHTLGVTCIAISRNFLYTGGFNGIIKVWDLQDFSELLEVHEDAIHGKINVIKAESQGDIDSILVGNGFMRQDAGIWQFEINRVGYKLQAQQRSKWKRVTALQSHLGTLYSGHGQEYEVNVYDDNSQHLHTIPITASVTALLIVEPYLFVTYADTIAAYDLQDYSLVWSHQEDGREVNAMVQIGENLCYSSRDKVQVVDLKSLKINSLLQI